jgi:hypothetical protein
MKKQVVVLKMTGLSIPEKIERSRFIVTSMTGNGNFPTPSPALDAITTCTINLEIASLASEGGGVDDTANMHAKELLLELALKSLTAYVEEIANSNPLDAETIILSAGMGVKAPGGRSSKDFEVTPTGNTDEVKLSIRSSPRATFIFQMTTDVGNPASWTAIGRSTRATMVKSGLTSGTRYYFRSAMIEKNGQNPWSDVKSCVAL